MDGVPTERGAGETLAFMLELTHVSRPHPGGHTGHGFERIARVTEARGLCFGIGTRSR